MFDAEFSMAENAGSYGTGAGDAAGDYGSAGADFERGSEDYPDYDEGPDAGDSYDSGDAEEGDSDFAAQGDSRNFSDFDSESRRTKREETRAFSQRLNARLDSEIAGYERQTTLSRQHESLSGDPKFGEVYKNNKDAIRYLADNIEGLDLEAASMLFVRHNLDKITEQARQRAVNEALARNRATFFSTPGSLSGGGDPPDNDIASMSPAEFARLVKRAEHGELKRG